MKTTKDGFEEGLEELARNKEIIVLSTKLKFAEKHPNKFIKTTDIGIASGMAHEGKTPFVTASGLGKNCQQIKEICANNENIKIIDFDEEFEDLAIARVLQNIKVIIPADYYEAKKATIAAGTTKGPFYLKLLTEKAHSTTEKTGFTIGRMEIIRAGKDCTIIATGPTLQNAVISAEKLAKTEIECTVLDCHTIQPIDKHALIASARLTGCIVATERTLGSAIAETISQNYPVPVRIATDNIITEVKNAVMQKCEVCGEIIEEHGKKLQYELRPELYFRLKNGGIIKSIPGLHKALLTMNDETFTYHCNTNKNDFSTWIKEAFNEPLLAKKIERMHTKIGVMLELIKWSK